MFMSPCYSSKDILKTKVYEMLIVTKFANKNADFVNKCKKGKVAFLILITVE